MASLLALLGTYGAVAAGWRAPVLGAAVVGVAVLPRRRGVGFLHERRTRERR